VLEKKFPFIRDDLFLVAQVDDETGRLFFTMQKINEISGKVEFESKNEHNYPGISNMSWEQSQKIKANQNYEEIFCAMKNSIHEIAKLGWKSIEYDVQIEEFIILDPPIQHCLIFFLLSIDPSHISLQLDLIEKQSTFEGKANMPSIVANLEPVVKVLVSPHKGMDLSFSQDYLDGLLENYEIFRWYDREEYVIKNFENFFYRIIQLNPPIYTFEKFFIVIGLKALDDEIFRKSISQYLRKQTQISHFYAKITPNLEYLDILLGLSNVNRSFGGRYLKSKIL